VHRDLAVLPAGAEAVGLAVDNAGLDRALGRIADAQLLARVAREAVDEDVRRRQQVIENGAPRIRPQVEFDAALVPVAQQVKHAVLRGDAVTELPQVITGARSLDLDHVGPEVTEKAAGLVTGRQYRAFQDPHATKQVHH
jgi:hypothetical protein